MEFLRHSGRQTASNGDDFRYTFYHTECRTQESIARIVLIRKVKLPKRVPFFSETARAISNFVIALLYQYDGGLSAGELID